MYQKPPVTFAMTVIALGLAGFVLMAVLVHLGVGQELDRALLLMLRDPLNTSDALGPAWFEEAAGEVTALGSYTVIGMAAVIALACLLFLRQRFAALFLAVTLIGGSLVSTLTKQFFDRPRPDVVDHMDQIFTASFPSGHAMVSMLAWMTLAVITIRFVPRHGLRVFILWAALVLALLIGVSRVYLGVHWPSDVIAGWCLGLAWASLAWLVAHYVAAGRERSSPVGHSRT